MRDITKGIRKPDPCKVGEVYKQFTESILKMEHFMKYDNKSTGLLIVELESEITNLWRTEPCNMQKRIKEILEYTNEIKKRLEKIDK